jgi:hypothetical protein
MSATIRIESGIAAGTNYWIDRPVLRIGSDPGCEICLPTADLPPHALTLEFRGGVYRAYNRGDSPISLGRTTLQAGAAGVWEDGDLLVLPGGQQLVLAIDGDPRPAPRPEAQTMERYSYDADVTPGDAAPGITPDAAKKAKSKSLMQMAVIGLCVVGMAGLLLLNNMSTTTGAPASNRPTFTEIVTQSLDQDETVRALVQKMQVAQSLVVRGDRDHAKLRFADLRDQLVRQTDSLPEADRKIADSIREYAETQLGQLQ